MAESYAPGASVCAVARRHGLSPQQLFTWRRNARRDGVPEEPPAFAPVVLDTTAAPAAPAVPGAPLIEIVVGDTVVRVPAGMDSATLKAVLRAVRGIR